MLVNNMEDQLPSTLLVWVWIGAAIEKNNMNVSKEMKNKTTV